MRDEKNGDGLWIGLAVVVGLALGPLAGWYVRDFFAVDACLDVGAAWMAPGVCVGVPAR